MSRTLRPRLLVVFVLGLAALAGAQDPVFRIVDQVGTLRFVSANRAGVSAWRALREIADLGVFQLELETPELRRLLEEQSLNLSFAKMEAVSVAELVAVAAGLDLVTERQEEESGSDEPGRLLATVVKAPGSTNEAVRQRLRDWALRWYRNVLGSELRQNRETADAEKRIHIDLALLDIAQGNLAAAASGLEWFAKNVPQHPWTPVALLKEAECYLELGQLEECSTKSSRVMKSFQSHEVAVPAALLFARANLRRAELEFEADRPALATSLLDNVVHTLELFLWGFRDRRDFPQLLLLLAEAHRQRGRSDLVLEKLRQLDSVIDPILLPDETWSSACFLRGTAEVAGGDVLAGERLLWQFVRHHPDDPRQASAWLGLLEAVLRAGDPLDGLFAARKALAPGGRLLPAERSRGRLLEARALRGLGKTEEAVAALEQEVKRLGAARVPDLVLELGMALLADGRPERAKVALEPSARLEGETGDRIRITLLEAEARQGNHEHLVSRARLYAELTRGSEAQARLAELVGDAWSALGDPRMAAAAYNGRIQ
jgi:tetratricopeptide (TPR) repeat protein